MMFKTYFPVLHLLYLMSFFFANAYDESDEPVVSPIVGGDYSENLRWFVTITARDGFCGGSVISHYSVLTAAHCFGNFTSVYNMYVHYGLRKLANREMIGIRSVFIHPEYRRTGLRNDIAVVFIKKPIEEFVSWLWHDVCPGSNVWAAGFGGIHYVNGSNRNATIQELSETLKKTSLTVIDAKSCTRLLLGRKIRHNYEICARADGTSPCQGDSGGPLYGYGLKNNKFLYGIVSSGLGCGDDRYPFIFVRIRPFMKWIYNTLRYKFKSSGIWRGS